jgi:hypothetical protein
MDVVKVGRSTTVMYHSTYILRQYEKASDKAIYKTTHLAAFQVQEAMGCPSQSLVAGWFVTNTCSITIYQIYDGFLCYYWHL